MAGIREGREQSEGAGTGETRPDTSPRCPHGLLHPTGHTTPASGLKHSGQELLLGDVLTGTSRVDAFPNLLLLSPVPSKVTCCKAPLVLCGSVLWFLCL